jgi:crotonobetainyl-CoA:carnitine CoA-transferase CaiB-like acyl-CoA transferase
MSLLRDLPAPGSYQLTGAGCYDSAFAVSALANASFAAVGQQLALLMQATDLSDAVLPVTVDQRLASLWFGYSFAAQGWELPNLWDPIAGNYPCGDGWIRLHTNLPHHRAAALRVLGCAADPAAVRSAVRSWNGNTLETEIVSAGGVAAAMRSRAKWLAHPQGRAVAAEPLIHWDTARAVTLKPRPAATASAPLRGLRVLDLTRVLAGPVATRTLAGFGAEVLRIDPPGWDEPGVIQDISLGKTMASLDLRDNTDREHFKGLLAQADVLVHGYRPDALDRLGFDRAVRDDLAPNRIEVTLSAYGWSGPWAQRRGFDSLVQMSAGISDAGAQWAGVDKPTPLPVQALDHATGYLMAAAVLSALHQAAVTRTTQTAQLSLARTAERLASLPEQNSLPQQTTAAPLLGQAIAADYCSQMEKSSWGPALRLKPALQIDATRMRWAQPARACGTAAANWAS